MKQEDKELLLRYLSMALPYNVYAHIRYKEGEPCYGKLTPRDIQWFIDSNIEVIKPYLRPMSSMTEEEMDAYANTGSFLYANGIPYNLVYTTEGLHFLLNNHFDIFGLIPRGLAIAITEENNPYNKQEE